MNFFEDQRLAKKKSDRLTFLFYIVSILVGVATSLFLAIALTVGSREIAGNSFEEMLFRVSSGEGLKILLSISICVSVAILARSYWEVTRLKTNPQSICTAMGAKQLSRETDDPKERQYLNIVEEMSIASSVPVPLIYILEDDAINAFACGFDINSAAVCVTTGCMRKLSRDELQAVVAHEFSHILNGDMTINLKLIGMLSGLILIYQAGYQIIRGSRHSRRSKKNDAGLLGVGLMAIGGMGYLGGSLLKAAISRQREFLADASSVQFTRNPQGIAGALKKIYVNSEKGIVASPSAQQASHMFLVEGVSDFFSFSTHPPLFKRIKAIEPNFSPKKFEAEEAKNILKEMYRLEKYTDEFESYQKRKINQQTVQEKIKEILPLFLMYQKHQDYKGLVLEVLKREKEEFKNLKPDQIEILFEKLSGELKQLPEEDRREILKELISKVNEGGKISFYEFLVVAYLKPALQPIKVGQKSISNSKFEELSQIMLSFFYYLDDNSKTIIDFTPLDKKELSYGKILASIEILRFTKTERKRVFVERLKKLALANSKISAQENVVFKLLCQTLSIPGIVLES